MKIDDSINKTAGLGVTSTQTKAGKSVSKSGTSSVSSDNVQFSSQVQDLASGSGVFDANKVEEIKAAIAGGQFQVDPEKVASGLISNVTDLLQTQTA